jgi:hypothetical protein
LTQPGYVLFAQARARWEHRGRPISRRIHKRGLRNRTPARFDLSIRYVGHAAKWDETRVEGDLSHRDGLVRFRHAGRDLAVATVERDNESLRAELTMRGFKRST